MRLIPQHQAMRELGRLAPRRKMISLILLMTVTSLTEGLGVLALVPVLGKLTGTSNDQLPRFVGRILDAFSPETALPLLLSLMVLVTAGRTLLVRAQTLSSSRLVLQLIDTLRAKAFAGVIRADWRWLAQTRSSDHSNLIVTNIAYVGSGFQQLLATLSLLIAASAYLITSFILSWSLTLAIMAGGAIVLVAFGGQRRHAERIGQALGKANASVHALIHQGFAGVRVIKAHGLERAQIEAFEASVQSVRAERHSHEQVAANGHAMLQIGGAIVLAAILYVGIVEWRVGIPTLLPLLFLFARMIPMVGGLQRSLSNIAHSRPALLEVQRLFDDTAAVAEPYCTVAETPLKLDKALTLAQATVQFDERERPALDKINLEVRARTTTAVFGPSGAGKSTLADIVMALIVPDDGQMLIDGKTLSDIERIQWRRSIAYVQQDPFLFNESIRYNLTLGQPGIDDATVADALRRAQADFVFALPDGADSIVGDGGVRLSGGERQRVALARALIRQPELLILDEATSALDPANEAAVRATTASLRGTMTMLVISHRESMQADADQVIELVNGRLIVRQPYADAMMASEA